MGEASRGVREFLNMCADVGSREESIARTVGATSQEAAKSTLIRRFRLTANRPHSLERDS